MWLNYPPKTSKMKILYIIYRLLPLLKGFFMKLPVKKTGKSLLPCLKVTSSCCGGPSVLEKIVVVGP